MTLLTDPRHRRLHATIIVAAVLLHLVLHYATYLPALRGPLGNLPYFKLHSLHEAEFLLVIAYAGVVFRLKGGLSVLLVTAVTSVPFVLTPYIFGREPRPNEVLDLVIQVVVVLGMGALIVLLHEAETRRRQAESTVQALREADQVKGAFISIASHELRNPLTVLNGFSELLLRRDAPDAQRQAWVQQMHTQTGRLVRIVDDMLDISRIQAGRLVVDREPVEVAKVVQESVRAFVDLNEKHTLAVDLPEGLPPVAGDGDKLVQVLVNLVSNAIKYSPAGGLVTVAAHLDAPRQRVVVSVADHGIGIAPEAQAGLFTLFHRVQSQETEGVPGSGLGLYIVKSLVERMRGEVWVESEPGRGSTFAFALPVAGVASDERRRIPAGGPAVIADRTKGGNPA